MIIRAAIALACAAAASCANPGAPDPRPAVGIWGGTGIRLDITASDAAIEYDCAHGTIDQPIVADRAGRFSARGTHVREHGGPIRIDEPPDRHPATYEGELSGNSLRLAVTLVDTHQTAGTFSATLNGAARLVKCL